MSPKLSILGLALALSLSPAGTLMAQPGSAAQPVKPTGPAAKKAEDLIHAYTTRIEKEIEQSRNEANRLRTELHELIDVRDAMAGAIAELRGELATSGTYSADSTTNMQQAHQFAPAKAYGMMAQTPSPLPFRRDFVYGLGTALPKEPTPEQREQLRRLTPRADLKRMIERLRAEVDETRTDVDELAYKLLELSSGIPTSFHGMGGGMGGQIGHWFGSMGSMGVHGGMM